MLLIGLQCDADMYASDMHAGYSDINRSETIEIRIKFNSVRVFELETQAYLCSLIYQHQVQGKPCTFD